MGCGNSGLAARQPAEKPQKLTPEARVLRAQMFADQGKLTQALAELEVVLQLDPSCARAYLERGNVRSTQREWDLAVEDYSTAIQFQHDYLMAYVMRARAFMQQQRLDEAMADSMAAGRLDTDNSQVAALKQSVLAALRSAAATLVAGRSASVSGTSDFSDDPFAGMDSPSSANCNPKLCMVCMDNDRGCRLRPCLHAALCVECAYELKKRRYGCPICSALVEDIEVGMFLTTFTVDDALALPGLRSASATSVHRSSSGTLRSALSFRGRHGLSTATGMPTLAEEGEAEGPARPPQQPTRASRRGSQLSVALPLPAAEPRTRNSVQEMEGAVPTSLPPVHARTQQETLSGALAVSSSGPSVASVADSVHRRSGRSSNRHDSTQQRTSRQDAAATSSDTIGRSMDAGRTDSGRQRDSGTSVTAPMNRSGRLHSLDSSTLAAGISGGTSMPPPPNTASTRSSSTGHLRPEIPAERTPSFQRRTSDAGPAIEGSSMDASLRRDSVSRTSPVSSAGQQGALHHNNGHGTGTGSRDTRDGRDKRKSASQRRESGDGETVRRGRQASGDGGKKQDSSSGNSSHGRGADTNSSAVAAAGFSKEASNSDCSGVRSSRSVPRREPDTVHFLGAHPQEGLRRNAVGGDRYHSDSGDNASETRASSNRPSSSSSVVPALPVLTGVESPPLSRPRSSHGSAASGQLPSTITARQPQQPRGERVSHDQALQASGSSGGRPTSRGSDSGLPQSSQPGTGNTSRTDVGSGSRSRRNSSSSDASAAGAVEIAGPTRALSNGHAAARLPAGKPGSLPPRPPTLSNSPVARSHEAFGAPVLVQEHSSTMAASILQRPAGSNSLSMSFDIEVMPAPPPALVAPGLVN